MSQDIIKVDPESLERVLGALSRIPYELETHYDRTVQTVTALSGEWDDVDYQKLLQVLKSTKFKINDIDERTQVLYLRIKDKLEIIRNIQSTKI